MSGSLRGGFHRPLRPRRCIKGRAVKREPLCFRRLDQTDAPVMRDAADPPFADYFSVGSQGRCRPFDELPMFLHHRHIGQFVRLCKRKICPVRGGRYVA